MIKFNPNSDQPFNDIFNIIREDAFLVYERYIDFLLEPDTFPGAYDELAAVFEGNMDEFQLLLHYAAEHAESIVVEAEISSYRIPEPLYNGTAETLSSIIDTMPAWIKTSLSRYSAAVKTATVLEDHDHALETLLDGVSIYEIDNRIFWAKTYARLNQKG